MRNSLSRPILGLQGTYRECESCCAFQAWCADPNSLNIVGDGLPTSLELFHAPQEIVPIQTLGYRFLDNHSSQNYTQSSDCVRMELVVEGVLQGMQHAAEGEAELRGPNDPIHFQMVKAQPPMLEKTE